MIHQGNLTIKTQEDAEKYKDLVEVAGNLRIASNVKLDAPKLETVGGNLYVTSDVKLDVPKLETVGGNLYITVM